MGKVSFDLKQADKLIRLDMKMNNVGSVMEWKLQIYLSIYL